MKNIELSIHEVRGLIRKYESELRQVNYQATRIKQILLELKTTLRNHKVEALNLPNLTDEFEISADKTVQTANLSTETITSAVRLPAYGYQMSTWDQFILNCLDQSEQIMESSDFLHAAKREQFHVSEGLNEDQVKGKISRSLHKLLNKKELLVKINTPGKGYAYALNTWLDEYGKLLPKYDSSNS